MTTARQDYRTNMRDAAANSEVRTGTGTDSAVSPAKLTQVAQGAAAAAQAAGESSGLSSDLGATLRAAIPPKGATRTVDNTGARPETGGRPGPDRGTDRGPSNR
ncbi:hypothetical protein JOF29_001287 [Kribbella aluminosa]|uniref:Uncharacterized protein n=1 Tax=Kribbella aluminosa TaxID=416017 RepID=A0ABS4UEY0_9ACTN|nr:hypothetical protein [Kribbella aluminosa]MBP2350204.1 hypothetical protein [Kribbella aluminosa]